MTISSPRQLEVLREGGQRLAAILATVAGAVRPGMATMELDEIAERMIREAGGAPVFKGYRLRTDEPAFPASICVSVNDEVVHGIPSRNRMLSRGDILGLDIGMRYPASGGLITDTAVTVPVGPVAKEAESLLTVTRAALAAGVAVLRSGIRMGDLGAAIQRSIEGGGFSVIRDLVGHGVGRHLHEDPYVPNYGKPGQGIKIAAGTVLAIEPMAAAGSPVVELADDGWTWKTKDGSLAAHFEHTVVVTEGGAEVLTRSMNQES
ncbi:MAG: type I methionyl aminopeptidase [Patescibacteria group bacterium]